MARTVSSSRWVSGTVEVMLMPPLSFFLKAICGGFLLSLMPKPSSSCCASWRRAGKRRGYLVHSQLFSLAKEAWKAPFYLNNLFVPKRLEHIEADENETACASHGNHLPTSTFAIFCALNDAEVIRGHARQSSDSPAQHFSRQNDTVIKKLTQANPAAGSLHLCI